MIKSGNSFRSMVFLASVLAGLSAPCAGGEKAVCDGSWYEVPGSGRARSQPVAVAGPYFSGTGGHGIWVFVQGLDDRIYYQLLDYTGWQDAWSVIPNGTTRMAPYVSGQDLMPRVYVKDSRPGHENMYLSQPTILERGQHHQVKRWGWTAWSDLGPGDTRWGTPVEARNSGTAYQFRLFRNDQRIFYRCSHGGRFDTEQFPPESKQEEYQRKAAKIRGLIEKGRLADALGQIKDGKREVFEFLTGTADAEERKKWLEVYYDYEAADQEAGSPQGWPGAPRPSWVYYQGKPGVKERALPAEAMEAYEAITAAGRELGLYRQGSESVDPLARWEERLSRLEAAAAFVEERAGKESDQLLAAWYKALLVYVTKTRPEFRKTLEARKTKEAREGRGGEGSKSFTTTAKPVDEPLGLVVGFTWQTHRDFLGDSKEFLTQHLKERFPDYWVDVKVDKGNWTAVFAPKDVNKLCGKLSVRFTDGPSLSGIVVVDMTPALAIVGKEFPLANGAVTVEFSEKFRVVSFERGLTPGPFKLTSSHDGLPFGLTVWPVKAGPCTSSDCPEADDHHHEALLFHSVGDSALARYQDSSSLLDLVKDVVSISYGPVSVSLEGVKLGGGGSAGLGAFKAGADKSFMIARFPSAPEIKTPEGGAVVTIGYSVTSVRDGKNNPDEEQHYIFSSGVGVKGGENQVRTSEKYKMPVRANYGQNTATAESKYLQAVMPPGLRAAGKEISSGFDGQQSAMAYVYESTRKASTNSVLVNRISFIALDVSLALSREQIPSSKMPLYLTFSAWPETKKR